MASSSLVVVFDVHSDAFCTLCCEGHTDDDMFLPCFQRRFSCQSVDPGNRMLHKPRRKEQYNFCGREAFFQSVDVRVETQLNECVQLVFCTAAVSHSITLNIWYRGQYSVFYNILSALPRKHMNSNITPCSSNCQGLNES